MLLINIANVLIYLKLLSIERRSRPIIYYSGFDCQLCILLIIVQCKHQLAARLSSSLGLCIDVEVTDDELALLLSKLQQNLLSWRKRTTSALYNSNSMPICYIGIANMKTISSASVLGQNDGISSWFMNSVIKVEILLTMILIV